MSSQDNKPEPTQLYANTLVPLPRVAIKFCVQCKWNLRAAYVRKKNKTSPHAIHVTFVRLHRPSSTMLFNEGRFDSGVTCLSSQCFRLKLIDSNNKVIHSKPFF